MGLLLLAFCGCLAAVAGVLYAALFVVHVGVPWLERYVTGRDDVFNRAANAKARELFFSKLGPAQRRSWHLRRRFTVTAPSGRRFTIAPYDPYNIRTTDALFCLQVGGDTPHYDKLLAQKLLIECDEALFLAKANVRSYSRDWDGRKKAALESCRARGLLAD